MKKSVLNFFLPSFFISLLLQITVVPQAFAFDELRTFRTGEFNLEAAFKYDQSTGNYDNGGKFASLPSDDSFSLMDLTLGGRWVLYPRVGVIVSTDIAQAQSKDLIKTRTQSSVTNVTAGFDYLWISHKTWALWPEFTLKYPFHRVDFNSDEVLNDEGAIEATARAVGRMRLGGFDTFAYVGYRYRDEGRSGVMPFGAGGEIPVSNLKVGADLSGYQTVVNDSGTGNTYNRDYVTYRDGGTLFFDSINPARLDANVWLKWNHDPVQIKVGGGTTLAAANIAGGWWAFAAVEYQLQTVWDKQRSHPINPSTPPGGQPYQNSHFQEELDDGVDQNLFVPPPPPPPPASAHPAPMLEESTTPVVKPKNPTKKEIRQMKKEQQQKMQNDLDQTEMQIELKSKKDHGSGD